MSEKYRNYSIPDLLDIIKSLQDRVSRLERTPQLTSSAVNTSGITVTGGSVIVRMPNDPLALQGIINIGSNATIYDETGMSIYIIRSNAVEGGAGAYGSLLMELLTVEGSAAPKNSTIKFYDKTGSTIFSDSLNARQGFDHPRLTNTWWDPTNGYISTTSGTFAGIADIRWYQYHPHIRIRVYTSNPATTTSEVRIVDVNNSNAVISGPQTGPANATTLLEFVVARSSMLNGANINGITELIEVQHRRASGAGTCTTLMTEAIGIDLSLSNPF